MSIIIERFNKIKSKVSNSTQIIAVSKTFNYEHIEPLVDFGHTHFGENKVQEADSKWNLIKKNNKNIKLHMIGKLQSNKAKKAVELFDYIHSLDSQKLADTLNKYQILLNKNVSYFIQVNLGSEWQKSGVMPNEIDDFYNYCTKEINLNVVGLMAIPPNDGNEKKYFKYLKEANNGLGLKELSMGMSADYLIAIDYKSTFIRIGSAIFGERNTNK